MSWQTKKLRELIDRSGPIFTVGVWDAFSAMLAEREGFEMVNLMGSMTAKSVIGKTDYGYITQTEMLDAARRVVQAVKVPVIVDVDDGFGHPMIVRRTVQLFEQVGVVGIIIEDLKTPLRCAAIGGGTMVPREVMVQKVRAAVEAKSDPDFLIIARTDTYEGNEEAISRIPIYAKVGADMGFVVALDRVVDIERLGKESPIPLMQLQIANTKIPSIPPDTLYRMGYKIVLYNSILFMASAKAIRDAARVLKDGLKDTTKVPPMAEGISTMEQEKMLGLAEDMALEERYRV